MPSYQRTLVPTPAAWSSSGAINVNLSNLPCTITGLYLMVEITNVDSNTATTALNDSWDRVITSLTLTGAGRNFFSFTDMRSAYFSQLPLLPGPFAPPRPDIIADGVTDGTITFGYYLPLGVKPVINDPSTGQLIRNTQDLTGGIPPQGNGNLFLQGTWGASTCLGTGYTLQGANLYVYYDGIFPYAGDPPESYLPRALPAWLMDNPTITGTSAPFLSTENFPIGHFLHSASLMTTAGSGTPRSSTVFSSQRIQAILTNQTIVQYGQSGTAQDADVAEIISQLGTTNPAFLDNPATPGTQTLGLAKQPGLYYFPMGPYLSTGGSPVYGLDLRNVGTGSYQFQSGVNNATLAAAAYFYRFYDMNPNYPAPTVIAQAGSKK